MNDKNKLPSLDATSLIVVEDEAIASLHIKKILSSLNASEIMLANSADQFYEISNHSTPDIILMDINLKGDKDGIELAEEIKNNMNVPIIYLTAYSDPVTVSRALATQPSAFLIKPFDQRELTIAIHLAKQKQKLEQELQHTLKQQKQLTNQMQEVQEKERKRIAHQIHDYVGQDLLGVKLQMEYLCKKIRSSSETPDIYTELQTLTEGLNGIIDTVDNITKEIRPPLLDKAGLKDAVVDLIARLEKTKNITFKIDINPLGYNAGDEDAVIIFRIIQEAVHNAIQHANASNIHVRTEKDAENITICIKDDGIGLDSNDINTSNSFGILGMKEKATQLGGTISITGDQGKGTNIELKIPV